MSDKLTNRLRGQYKIGPEGVYGTRDFSGFIPPICIEAADEIERLQKELDEANKRIKFLDKASDQDAIKDDKMFSDLEKAEASNKVLREALEEICEPTEPDYYTGIRCGVEDRDLQGDPYEAAEYGYDQGKEYCQFIAQQALTHKEEADLLDFDYEIDSKPPEKGGQTLCGRLGRKHKMKRNNSLHTGCIYPGCDACQ